MSASIGKVMQTGLVVVRAPHCGYYVTDRGIPYEQSRVLAAFTSLNEALDFVREEMREQPGTLSAYSSDGDSVA